MMLLIYLCVAVAVAAWMVAVVACVRLFPLRQDEIGGWEMLFNGLVWFRPATFKPVAAGLHRMFRGAFATFFAALFLAMLSVVSTQL